MHPTTGAWLPKGGRKRGTGKGGQKPASFIPQNIPRPAAENGTPPPQPTPAAEPGGIDCSEEAGDAVAHGIQFVTGVVLDAFEDATCSPAEHKKMAEALAAYFRAMGLRAAAWVALVLVLTGYFLRTFKQEKPRAKVRSWIHGEAARVAAAKDVTPRAENTGAARSADAATGDSRPPAASSSPRTVYDLIPTFEPE
ncbi:MAG: hypothetical protein C0502_05000 [Opitutus sp.]|nr:hypothetical protein [Opitutus sp.]